MPPQTAVTALLTLALSFTVVTAEAGHNDTHPPRPEQSQHLQASLQALRSALVRIGSEKQREDFTAPIAEKSLQLENSALSLIKEGDLTGAQQQLGAAMELIKTAISTLRNQETLIRSLNFASAEDEYLYEKQRYQSYSMLADLLIKNRDDSAAIELRQQAKNIAETATEQAADQAFSEALKNQERSNHLVIKAIRRSGVYIPG